jgi:uroporphyrinogen-III decarboxylase
VLREVQQRTAQKTRRRKPPTWAMKIAAAFQASKRFVRITVPQWLKSHREEIKTAAI